MLNVLISAYFPEKITSHPATFSFPIFQRTLYLFVQTINFTPMPPLSLELAQRSKDVLLKASLPLEHSAAGQVTLTFP